MSVFRLIINDTKRFGFIFEPLSMYKYILTCKSRKIEKDRERKRCYIKLESHVSHIFINDID